MSDSTWKLVKEDSSVEEFIDIRRKVGNQVVRAYLLSGMKEKGRVVRVTARLRGPKDEFKDFAGFLVLHVKNNDSEFNVLAETGIYENLRIVATDSEELAQQSPENVIRAFTDALEEPEANNALLILSKDSKVG